MSVLLAALSAPLLYKHPPVGSRSFFIIGGHLFVKYVEIHGFWCLDVSLELWFSVVISINLVLTFVSRKKNTITQIFTDIVDP